MSSYKLQEALKPILTLEQTEVGTSTSDQATTRIKLGDFRRCMFVVMIETAADFNFRTDQKVGLTLRQATAVTGGTATDVDDQVAVEGGVDANVVQIDVSNAADGDITVNGTEFAFDTQTTENWTNWETATELETALNAAFPELTIARSTNVITISSTEPGENIITIEEDVTHADTFAGTKKATAIFEVYAPQLDSDKEYTFVEIDNDMSDQTTGAVDVTVLAVLGEPYKRPVTQSVAIQE